MYPRGYIGRERVKLFDNFSNSLTLSRPKEKKTNFEKDSLKMRLSGYRLKFAELIGPWTFNHSDKENEIFPKCIPGDTLVVKGLNRKFFK